MQDKKLTIKRIAIYTVLAYLPLYVWGAFCIKGEGEDLEVLSVTYGLMTMMFPTIAHILTRVITKEGFHNTYLGAGKKGSGKYYIASIGIPVAASLFGGVMIGAFTLKDWSLSQTIGSDGNWAMYLFTTGLIVSISTVVRGFGEEFGWRAYLTPKLEELMPTPWAVVVTGIIWSFWHAPFIVRGYNFGTNYSFYPYGGLAAMAVFCILTAAILTWLTKKTNSVYPAAICHAFIDGLNVYCVNMFAAKSIEEKFEYKYNDFTTSCMLLAVYGVFGIAAFVFMKNRKDKMVEKAEPFAES